MEVTFELLKNLGFKCPRCGHTEIRSGDLEDVQFASHDHYICISCGLRWQSSHWTKNPLLKDTIIRQCIQSEFIWVLCSRKTLEPVKT